MINFSIICVGKIKEKYLVSAIEEYQKRISRYAKLEIIEIPDEKNPTNDSEAEIKRILELEAFQIIDKMPKDAYVITLEIEGEQVTSEGFADLFDKVTQFDSNKIVLIIGSSHGLSPRIKSLKNKAISFSKMTFPHQLMRVILLEQLYRGLSILNHTSYHK